MKTTINNLRALGYSSDKWQNFLSRRSHKNNGDKEIRIVKIINDLNILNALRALEAVEGHDREMRLFAVACARRYKYLMDDQRGVAILDVAERFANGQATKKEMEYAMLEADKLIALTVKEEVTNHHEWIFYWAAWEIAALVVSDMAWQAAYRAADLAWNYTGKEELAWQEDELRRVCLAIEAGKNPYPKKEVVK